MDHEQLFWNMWPEHGELKVHVLDHVQGTKFYAVCGESHQKRHCQRSNEIPIKYKRCERCQGIGVRERIVSG